MGVVFDEFKDLLYIGYGNLLRHCHLLLASQMNVSIHVGFDAARSMLGNQAFGTAQIHFTF